MSEESKKQENKEEVSVVDYHEELKIINRQMEQQIAERQIRLDNLNQQQRTKDIKREVDDRIEITQVQRKADYEKKKLGIESDKLMSRERLVKRLEDELNSREKGVCKREEIGLDLEERKQKLLTELSAFNNYKNQVNKELTVAKEIIEEAKAKNQSLKQNYMDMNVAKKVINDKIILLDKRECKLTEDIKNFDLLKMQYESKDINKQESNTREVVHA